MKFPFNFWGNPAGTVIARRSVATDPHAAIKVATASTVDWGDGSPLESATANVQLNHVYTALGEMTVTITAMTPAPMNPDLSLKHPASTAVDAGWKEVIIRDPQLTGFTVKPNASLRTFRLLGTCKWVAPYRPDNLSRMPDLEEIELHGYIATQQPSGWCIGNTNLRRFTSLTPAFGGGATASFYLCKSLDSVQWDISKTTLPNEMFRDGHINFNPVYDLPEATDLSFFMINTTGVTSVTLTNTRKVKLAPSAFRSPSLVTVNRMDFEALINATAMCMAPSMVHHPGWNGELVQDVSNLFTNCALLETVGDIGMANVTNTNQMFQGCAKLRSVTLRGLKVSVAINGLKLDATALDAVFTSLGTANAGATINITGNPGAATCNKTIATSKGWGVTG